MERAAGGAAGTVQFADGAGCSRSFLAGLAMVAPESSRGSLDARCTGAKAVSPASCRRIGQYVPGAPPSLSSVTPPAELWAGCDRGTGVNPWDAQSPLKPDLTRDRPGANANAAAALTATATAVITRARRSIRPD